MTTHARNWTPREEQAAHRVWVLDQLRDLNAAARPLFAAAADTSDSLRDLTATLRRHYSPLLRACQAATDAFRADAAQTTEETLRALEAAVDAYQAAYDSTPQTGEDR